MANLYYFLDMRRPKDGRGTLKIALQHRQKVSYKSLEIYLRPNEWDASKNQVLGRPDKKFLNAEIRQIYATLATNLAKMEVKRDFYSQSATKLMELAFRRTSSFEQEEVEDYVSPVYNEYITLCRKKSTAQVFMSSLRNLTEYCGDIESLRFTDITGAWLRKYQNWLLDDKDGKGMEVNGANVYLRNLRTVFNYALNNQKTDARYPFKDIDMSTTDPDKRMIPYAKFLEWATKPMPDYRTFYRDLFMLSFYLCGIRPIDLLYVKKNQVQENRLIYKPEKLNGRTTLSIKIEPEAWEIIKKYEGQEYLINVMESRSDYKQFAKQWNTAIRAIGEDVLGQKIGRNGAKYTTVKHIGIVPYITVYYARTCWATYAYNILDVPMDTISQALGHKNGLRVTNFYVKRDSKRVDKANRDLIDRVKADMQKLTEKATTSA